MLLQAFRKNAGTAADEPRRSEPHVFHETIYCAIDALPRGELRSELNCPIALRPQGANAPHTFPGQAGTLPNMTSIHLRPVEVAARLVPGHWEGHHIKGPGNRSSVGTLVERKSRYLMLVKLRNSSAEATLEGFTRKFRHVSFAMKKSLTYNQGREMAHHEIRAKRAKIDVYFADPHSPW